MILPLLLANFGLAAFTNRCRNIHRSQNSSVCILGVSSTQSCGGQSRELRCVGVPSFVGVSPIIGRGFKCHIGWSLEGGKAPSALCWCELWILLIFRPQCCPMLLTWLSLLMGTRQHLLTEWLQFNLGVFPH